MCTSASQGGLQARCPAAPRQLREPLLKALCMVSVKRGEDSPNASVFTHPYHPVISQSNFLGRSGCAPQAQKMACDGAVKQLPGSCAGLDVRQQVAHEAVVLSLARHSLPHILEPKAPCVTMSYHRTSIHQQDSCNRSQATNNNSSNSTCKNSCRTAEYVDIVDSSATTFSLEYEIS
jgi:hypothetical protein